MAVFEVFIPSAVPNGFNVTARIQADSWIQALRDGLSRLEGSAKNIQNLLCDIKENGMEVTEPTSGRVFRIRELAEVQPASVVSGPGPAPLPTHLQPQQTIPEQHPDQDAGQKQTSQAGKEATPLTAPSAHPAAQGPKKVFAPPPPAKKIAKPALSAQNVLPRGKHTPMAQAGAFSNEQNVIREKASGASAIQMGRVPKKQKPIEDIIDELFASTQRMYEQKHAKGAASFVLALAQRTIASDAGSVLIADINRNDLYFVAATGSKADDVMKFRVPMGQGIVGFCAQEGVSLAVSDVHRDERFYAKIAKSLGFETKSLLCAPVQQEGRVYGAIELVNKKFTTSFTRDEVNILNYLAHQFAEYLVNTGHFA